MLQIVHFILLSHHHISYSYQSSRELDSFNITILYQIQYLQSLHILTNIEFQTKHETKLGIMKAALLQVHVVFPSIHYHPLH